MFGIFLRKNPTRHQKRAGIDLPPRARAQHSTNPMDLQDGPGCRERENLQEKPALIFLGLGESVEFQEIHPGADKTTTFIQGNPVPDSLIGFGSWLCLIPPGITTNRKILPCSFVLKGGNLINQFLFHLPAQPDSLPLSNPETKLVWE